jgi:hypothetical protein
VEGIRQIPFRMEGTPGDTAYVRVASAIKSHFASSPDSDTLHLSVPAGDALVFSYSPGQEINTPYKFVLTSWQWPFLSYYSDIDVYAWFSDHSTSPDAPAGVTASILTFSSVLISFDEPDKRASGYAILRSDTYHPDFIRISTLRGNEYAYIDPTILPGRDYAYRVVAIGTERSAISESVVVYSQDITTRVPENLTEDSIRAYPNPADEHLILESQAADNAINILGIFDMQGRMVLSCPFQYVFIIKRMEIDVGDLKPGLYIIVYQINGTTRLLRFIKS